MHFLVQELGTSEVPISCEKLSFSREYGKSGSTNPGPFERPWMKTTDFFMTLCSVHALFVPFQRFCSLYLMLVYICDYCHPLDLSMHCQTPGMFFFYVVDHFSLLQKINKLWAFLNRKLNFSVALTNLVTELLHFVYFSGVLGLGDFFISSTSSYCRNTY